MFKKWGKRFILKDRYFLEITSSSGRGIKRGADKRRVPYAAKPLDGVITVKFCDEDAFNEAQKHIQLSNFLSQRLIRYFLDKYLEFCSGRLSEIKGDADGNNESMNRDRQKSSKHS